MANAQLGSVLRHIRELAATPHGSSQSDGMLLRAFVTHNDQTAFTTIVKRHGPLVLAVCRRVLHSWHDAEDAFQATFILLARNAASIRKQESLASWLHGVAYRMARNARRAAARRRRYEGEAKPMPDTSPGWETAWREVQAALDEEIQRLPEIYRSAFILCCLEGRSRPEAAQAIGIKEATLRSRLAKARSLVQQALARRGIALSAVLAAAVLSNGTAAAALPLTFVSATARAATRFAASEGRAAGIVSARVAALVKGTQTAMFSSKLKTTTVLLLTLVLSGVGLGLRALSQAEGQPPPAQPQQPAAAARTRESQTVRVHGRVLDPDGKPQSGAKLYLNYFSPRPMTYPVRATTGAEGRFAFTFDRAELDRTFSDTPGSEVVAVAPNQGFVVAPIRETIRDAEVTLRLVRDVPIRGRVLDSDGKAVVGARVRIREIRIFAGESLDAELADVRKGGFGTLPAKFWSGPLPGQAREVATGADGRFRLMGVGRERLVNLQIEGPAIHYTSIAVMTRTAETVVGTSPHHGIKIYGAAFDYLASPSRPVRGVVRDKDSGKPITDVAISSFSTTHTTRTDKQGRYELLGCLKAKETIINVAPLEGRPYFRSGFRFSDMPGLTPLTADIELVRGIPLRGRLTESRTGKPIANATVEYRALYPNPYDRGGVSSLARTGRDGAFAIVVLPGPGVLGATALDHAAYMPARITPQQMKEFFKDSRSWSDTGNSERSLLVSAGENAAQGMIQEHYNALVLLEPAEKSQPLESNLVLRPARALKGRIVGPDGRPLTGTLVYGLSLDHTFTPQKLETDAFTVTGLNPRRSRQLLFYHKEKNLGLFREVAGDEPEPLQVRLQPCGSASGRVVDRDGLPLSGVTLQFNRQGLLGPGGPETTTDRDGRFRAEGLAVGQKYWLMLAKRPETVIHTEVLIATPAEKKDLGDVTVEENR